KRIAQSVDSDFADPKKELVTTSQRYNEIVDQIVKVNPSLANEPSLRNFDPNSQVALLFALGEKNTGYGQYTATIGEAKLGDKNSIEVDLTYTVPFVDQNGKIVSPANNLPPGVEVEDPNREKVSRPFDLQIISKIKDKAGNPVPIVFKDPVPNVATSPLA
ncbi:MAG TPA: hypothetical protein VG917_01320, partial [Patescibacteria group bacterium]|nr:hypothetical protein [Patescibacteria group bacterium]